MGKGWEKEEGWWDCGQLTRKWAEGLGPHTCARSKPFSWAAHNSSRLLCSAQICASAIEFGDIDPNRPFGAVVALPEVWGKVSPCSVVVQQ